MKDLVQKVGDWHHARNLIDGSTDQAQYVKLIEEAGELAGNIARGKCIKDDVGDMLVVLINLCGRNNITLEECLQVAYDDIKHRKGKMVDGVFIKDESTTPLGSIPLDATHTSATGGFHKMSSDDKFWCVWSDEVWKVMSGEPVGLESLHN